jgi:hypothetical protein
MSLVKENAAPRKHHNDGPPRLDSSRCGTYGTPAAGLNQSSSGMPSRINRKAEGAGMNQELAAKRAEQFSIIEQVAIQGDLSKLSGEQRVMYYNKVCESCGLNPFTNPFSYLQLGGKLVLYAKKDCSEQLRKINGVSIEELEGHLVDDVYVVTAKARDKTGRVDQAKGALVVGNLRGEAKANAMMKAETKAKRRVTLSICGLGFTDDSEVESIPGAVPIDVDFSTGEIKGIASKQEAPSTLQIEEKPVINGSPKITERQIAELDLILGECDPKYKNLFYRIVKKRFGSDDLSGITVDRYDGAKATATTAMEEYYAKLGAESDAEVAAGAK